MNHHQTEKEPFVTIKVSEVENVRHILKARLPRSAHVYNMTLLAEIFPKEMHIFSLFGKLDKDAVIVAIFDREDTNQDINISVPETFVITEEVKNAFIQTKTIDWKGLHLFTATDRLISPMIFDISAFTFQNKVTFYPNYAYVLDPEEALKFEIELDHGLKLKPLDAENGVKFFKKVWRYFRPGGEIYFAKMLQKLPSCGIYDAQGSITSGVVMLGHGLPGALNTDPAHQRKGHGLIVMKCVLKEMAKKGFIPASTSQQENTNSVKLHEKVGMKVAHECDYIQHCI